MTVCVIGGGLAGAAAALELRRHEVDVLMLDRAAAPMSDASRFNEGKIHLGYVYAFDPTKRTEELMIHGAMTFEPLMRRWLGSGWDAVAISEAFEYAVHPQSIASPAFLAERYRQIQHKIRRCAGKDGSFDYLRIPEPAAGAWESSAVGCRAANVFRSQERAVEPFQLADAVVAALHRSGTEIRCGVEVVRVRQVGTAYFVDTSGGTSLGPFAGVVNASWVSAQAIDRTMGFEPDPALSYRFKYFLRIARSGIADFLPCRTIVVGPFGDVVTYGRDLAYLSWYPAGRVAWSDATSPPRLPSRLPTAQARALGKSIVDGLAPLVPGVRAIDVRRDDIEVFGGPIVAVGASEIDDPKSGLHRRDAIGVRSVGGYHSVRTGKLTTAPYFGHASAQAVLAA